MMMYIKALKIRVETLGLHHPAVAISYNNMGSVLEGQGRVEEAMAMFEQALTIQLEALEECHPDVVSWGCCHSQSPNRSNHKPLTTNQPVPFPFIT